MKHASMHAVAVMLLGASALTFSACQINNTETDESAERDPIAATPLGMGVWSEALSAMTSAERDDFHAISDADERQDFLRQRGIDMRLAMADRLREGMSTDEAMSAMDGLYDRRAYQHNNEHVYLSAFNGAGSTNMFLRFVPGESGLSLHSWGSYTDLETNESTKLMRIEADLRERLDRVLRVGMGQNEIKGVKTSADELRRRYMEMVEDRRATQNYGINANSNTWSPNYSDFALEEQVAYVENATKAYAVLDREPDYIRVDGDFEYWYHKIPVRNSETFIVLEYRFEGRRLLNYYVYHTDFLGFDTSTH